MSTTVRNHGLETDNDLSQAATGVLSPKASLNFISCLRHGVALLGGGVVLVASVSTGHITHIERIYKQLEIDRLSSAREVLPAQGQQITKIYNESTSKPIWEIIQEEFSHVSDEELEAWPVDGAAQVDHYLYGTPKR